jgi:hypothetical protein
MIRGPVEIASRREVADFPPKPDDPLVVSNSRPLHRKSRLKRRIRSRSTDYSTDHLQQSMKNGDAVVEVRGRLGPAALKRNQRHSRWTQKGVLSGQLSVPVAGHRDYEQRATGTASQNAPEPGVQGRIVGQLEMIGHVGARAIRISLKSNSSVSKGDHRDGRPISIAISRPAGDPDLRFVQPG